LNLEENPLLGRDFFIKFADELKRKNRFFIDTDYIELFDIIIAQSEEEIRPKALYRGRINKKNDTTPYINSDIGMPSTDIATSHGRANPYGINYMYLAENTDTVIAELRPNIGNFISVGKFKLQKPKKVIKLGDIASLGGTIYDKWDTGFATQFMLYLILSFSSPIYGSDKELDYLPSQYFSEYCKTKHFDGIMFLSSVMEKSSGANYNYVFFEDTNIIYESTDVYHVDRLKYSATKI
jgi:hypothetical protein